MRRAVPVALVAVVLLGTAFLALGASGDDGARRWYVELDNAFGLADGGDVKIAGVRAGTIEKIGLQRRGMRARLTIAVTDRGFGELRADATCESRPQSLIGEYFLDCKPGTSPQPLPPGGTVPVERTSSTIPLDLIQNIMRRPVRERFSIFLSELGIGLAARGDDVNETIRRANPALRETDRLLELLAEEREVIRDLYDDADAVLLRLRERKRDVSRFIAEARDTSRASAVNERELARTFELLPTFLRELRPTMRRLGRAAAEQRPAVTALSRQTGVLTGLLDALGPFSDASRPATQALAGAARRGRPAVRAARGPLRTLRGAARPLPEIATNLAFTLQHLDDPRNAVEKDARSGRPDGGFTGLEALLRYVWSQSQAINVHDANSYNLKVALFVDRVCGAYSDAETAAQPENARCRTWLGPNQPGITTRDPTATEHPAPNAANPNPAGTPAAAAAWRSLARRPVEPSRPAAAPAARAATAPATRPQQLASLLDAARTGTPPELPAAGREALLDFLLAP
jgi:virulence factor Mce-like protein